MTIKRIIKGIVRTPMVNRVVREMLRFCSSRSQVLFARFIRYAQVSGRVELLVGKQRIAVWSAGDDALVSKLFYQNQWEKDVVFWFVSLCRRRHSIVDAGANIGLYSILASKSNPDAIVHAFEPNPYNATRFRKNLVLNDVQSRVHVHEAALGDQVGHVAFHVPEGNLISDVSSVYRSHSQSFNDFNHKKISVSSTTLDRFCAETDFVPDVVKVDVELYELQVLRGMKTLLQSVRPIIFCEIFNDEVKRKVNPALDGELEKGYTDRLQAFLRSMNYHFYLIVPSGILFVETLKLSPISSMYLLLPLKLKQPFYLSSESNLVLSELGYD